MTPEIYQSLGIIRKAKRESYRCYSIIESILLNCEREQLPVPEYIGKLIKSIRFDVLNEINTDHCQYIIPFGNN